MGFPGAGGEDCVGPEEMEDEAVRGVGRGAGGGGEAKGFEEGRRHSVDVV